MTLLIFGFLFCRVSLGVRPPVKAHTMYRVKSTPMKTTLQLLTLGLFMVALSSCDTYVSGGGYAGARPGYYNRGPSHHYPSNSWNNNNHGHYSHNHPGYYNSRPAPRGVGAGARVNTSGLPLNVNSNTRLGIF
ncbi:MAG: hypothetical protein JWR15_4439 [Prosthecobacter sp.]|nr:hypothetical protein [Prosthecobacter sp.]